MKITLISPYPDVTAFGLRTMSAYLREQGFATRMVFLPDPFGDDLQMGVDRYPPQVMTELAELCADSDLIGVTLMTNYFDAAIQITRAVRSRCPAPVVWGGVHPTIRGEECLEHADIICVGDGEDALLDLARAIRAGEDTSGIANLWVKQGDGTIRRNPVRALPVDLDIYPIPDYSQEDHFVMHEGRLQPMTVGIIKHFLENGTVSQYLHKIGYQTMTGRGCPHMCSYCINDAVKSLYGSKGYLRWRSTEHLMREYEYIKRQLPFVEFLWISDDAFFARTRQNLREYCDALKARIGMPFSCLASPLTVTEEKMDILVDGGLIYVQMGIQSGSSAMQELFNRKKMDNRRILEAARVINKYRDRMAPPSYDFILDVPYESEEDTIESLRLIADLPKPYKLQPFSLVLYPGTKLHDMSIQDGLVKDEKKEIYNKSYTMREPNFLNLLITLAKGGKFPSRLLKWLVEPPVIDVLNSRVMKPFFRWLYISLQQSYFLYKRALGRA